MLACAHIPGGGYESGMGVARVFKIGPAGKAPRFAIPAAWRRSCRLSKSGCSPVLSLPTISLPGNAAVPPHPQASTLKAPTMQRQTDARSQSVESAARAKQEGSEKA